MKSTTLSALIFAASIALAIAVPARTYYYDDDYPDDKPIIAGRPISLATAPFYYQPRTLEIEDSPRGRKYQIVKRKKNPGGPKGSDEDSSQGDEASDESSEEDEEEDDEQNNEENNEENDDEESMDVPPWEQLFPEEDKNTGTFDTPADSQGQGGPHADMPSGAPAPSNAGSLMSLLTGGFGNNKGPQGGDSQGGPQSQYGQGGPQPQYGQSGPPPQYRQGPPPPYQAVRARTSLDSVEEPRSGGAVLYDGYRYIPVKPVQVRVPKRQAKKVTPKTKPAPKQSKARSLVPVVPTPAVPVRKQKKLTATPKKPQYVLVPVQRDSREIRFARDQHGFTLNSGPDFRPQEIWRWEGAGGRPLRKRDNRPSGVYYSPRPQRGSAPAIRFAEESDY